MWLFSILQGGVSTGLTHVEHAKTPKLYIVKGKRQPIIRQLPTISWKEFNDGDAFVLDTMTHIFVWTGKNSNRLEKLQAAKVKYTRMNHVKHNRHNISRCSKFNQQLIK